MTKTRKLTVHAALMTVGVALLVLAGGIVAGNMGFKITVQLDKAGTSPTVLSASGTNYVALPYGRKAGLITAKDLFLDVCNPPSGTCPAGAVQLINKHRKIDDAFDVYTFGGGTLPPNGWNLQAGEGYVLKVGANANYVVPGSHLPDVTVQLIGAGVGVSKSGTNYYAPPYHGVAKNAKELFLEIGGSVQLINQHRKSNDAFDVYTFGGGTLPPNGWNLKSGEAYIIKVGTSQRYKPLHY